jgi:hypothetical protein
VLIEAKLTAGTQHPAKLGERGALVWHRAEHPGHDHDIDGVRRQL